MSSVHDQITEHFRRWEIRGRGWQVFNEPVYPEPPFQPFEGIQESDAPATDEGRRLTLLGSLFHRLTSPPPRPDPVIELEDEPEPVSLVRERMIELQTSLPAKLDISRDVFEQFLSNLSYCTEPIAFELLGLQNRVLAQFASSPEDVSIVRRQLQAYFPEATFIEREGMLDAAWEASKGDEAVAVEFGLEKEFMFPLASGKIDPFVGIIAALSELQAGELAFFQVIWQPVRDEWAESIVNSVTHADGKPFFVNLPELTKAAENKVTSSLYAAVVRVMVRTQAPDRLYGILRDLAGSLRVFGNPKGNALIPLHNEDYPFEDHIEDALCRQSRRTGMLLNSEELTGFVHLPSSAVRSPALVRYSGKTKAAPDIVKKLPGVLIGDNEHAGQSVPVYLSTDLRSHHVHILGKSGCGKSSLFLQMIRQDIVSGEGVAVLDPHGDLIDQILGIIPEDRLDDVILVDPSDDEFPIGFNILQAHSEEEKSLLASDLIATFRRLSTSWGDQMDTVLQNAILVFLESSRRGTLADLRRFLIEPSFRTEFLRTVKDPELIYYWHKVFPQLTGNRSIGPVLTRLQDFFSQKRIRNMVSQPENKLDFADIMDSGKIFLAKLSAGLGGSANSYMLGTLLVSKFQQMAMARQSQAAERRRQFWLYIDEFDHFISPSMAEILTGARKYRLGLILAHQELHQLQCDPKVASAVLSEPATRIVFSVGDDDARKLAEGFESFDAKCLKTLEKFHAIVRVERNDFDFNLSLRKPESAEPAFAEARKAAIVAGTRTRYATPRATVEAALFASLNVAEEKKSEQPKPAPPPAGPVLKPSEPPKVAEVRKDFLTGSGKETVVSPVGPMTEAVNKPDTTPVIKPESAPPTDLGRGGQQHKTIQERLQMEAHTLGFLAQVECQLDKQSLAAADLVLRRGCLVIAIEIAITTTIDHEFGNVKKCLAAGFDRVVVVSPKPEKLKQIREAVEAGLGTEIATKVTYHSPDGFIAELRRLPAEEPAKSPATSAERITRGYKVRRHTLTLTPEEQKAKEDMAIRLIAEVMRRKS